MKHSTLLPFASDYMKSAHPSILNRLQQTCGQAFSGYGTDSICAAAREKILTACQLAQGEVFFLTGGTQTNATVIDALLHSYEGVIAAETGHVSLHEAGAIEFGGHKVLTLTAKHGKITAATLAEFLTAFQQDENHDHMVAPGMVYLSQPTEYGTLYQKAELAAIYAICKEYRLSLYIDGARLAYALAAPDNDVSLPDLAQLCDVFYIGGTKCGAMFGEAVVLTKPQMIPHFFTIIKQHGALLAKGWLLGLQFAELFSNGLYGKIGQNAIEQANKIRTKLTQNGYTFLFPTTTNQIFIIADNAWLTTLKNNVSYGFWEKYDETHTVIRLATSWATTDTDTENLLAIL